MIACELLQSKGLSKQAEEDPFDSITDKIPERPVSVAEGASYSLVILAGLAVAGVAAYAVLKELIFQPKEYVVPHNTVVHFSLKYNYWLDRYCIDGLASWNSD